MTSPCDITPTQNQVVKKGALQIELWIAKELCLESSGQTTNLSSAALHVRIVNTGANAVQLVAADPDALFIAKIWDADQPASMIELSPGPEPEDIATVQVEIAPGGAWDSRPIENYMNVLVADMLKGARIDGSPLPDAARMRRVFGVEALFAATLNSGTGFVAFEQNLKGVVEMVQVPAAQ
ncbi:hypothetical protein BCF46_0618 [Litoreibacter meonggei]|uniref:Uncharacterized protein n=1 Tax=Litoreibacter meonggei TaxID=1049199 RepID=A0A497X568_9RHOB|nr:hypothetical protein [Litoreibacter meonggei]RLJ60419.1 hypothetical protein BCF46_0618 [Litoreibacter meonggei]